jgi:hypothetical protein
VQKEEIAGPAVAVIGWELEVIDILESAGLIDSKLTLEWSTRVALGEQLPSFILDMYKGYTGDEDFSAFMLQEKPKW